MTNGVERSHQMAQTHAMPPTIIALSRDPAHRFSKQPAEQLTLLAGLGIEGDAHAGRTVQHHSRIAKNPNEPNLRQVHLIHAELFDELAAKGFTVEPGQLGENITTRGIDLLGLSRGTRLRLGDEALIEITGLRNPCHQIDGLAKGLMAATLDKAPDGSLVRKSGVMAVVVTSGDVRVGDGIELASVPMQFEALGVV
jgi:MOSC domain-containing protein YiiM